LDLLKRKATDEISVSIPIGTDYSMGEKIGEWLKELLAYRGMPFTHVNTNKTNDNNNR
jgi:hypothetical protein